MAILAVLIFACLYAATQPQWYTTTIILALMVLAGLAEMIRFTEKWRRDLHKFLKAVKYRDFSGFQAEHHFTGKSPEYQKAFHEIAREFQQVRLEKEAHYQYLQTLIHHVDTAIICFDHKGEVVFSNASANSFFGVNQLRGMEHIKRLCPEMYKFLHSAEAGRDILTILLRGKLFRLSIQQTRFKAQNLDLHLISFRDIKNELEETELESWKKLIQVLTHEIMNSATPVASLSSASLKILNASPIKAVEGFLIPSSDFKDLYRCIETVEERSRGMLKFVDDYKNISKLPGPQFETVVVKNLVKYVTNLLQSEFDKRKIDIRINIQPPELALNADHEMMQRVLINLMLNSIYALEETKNPYIAVSAKKTGDHKTELLITDNGRGIPQPDMEKIFIPFFSTRKGGSGMGLGITREIIRMHRGKIQVTSRVGNGTSFTLQL